MNTDTRSPSSRAPSTIVLGACAALLAALVLTRLSAYGIWDPWELSVADTARKLAEGAKLEQTITLPMRLVSASFAAFGAREWAGRLPMALSGLLLLIATGLWVGNLAGRRSGLYAALILGSTPLFLLHSREMVGATPALLGSTLVMLGASVAVFGAASSAGRTFGWLAVGVVGAVIGAFSAGVLSAVLPPLVAVSAWLVWSGLARSAEGAARIACFSVLGATALCLVMVTLTVFRHAADYSFWVGGAPLDGALVTYERTIERLFHAFAPWSAVLPIALATVLRDARNRGARGALAVVAMLWAALSYAAHALYLSSFGQVAYLAPAALAATAALWLEQREDSDERDIPQLIVIVLLVGLIIRDFALYPGSPFGALELGEAKTPDVFNPKRYWSACLGFFALALVITSIAGGERGALDLKAPYRGLKDLWKRSWGHRGWLIAFALLLGYLLVFGILAFAIPRTLHLTSLGARIARVLMFVPIALPIAVAGAQLVYHYSAKLKALRSAPVLIAALLVGAYTSQLFLPELSAHFSPRVVFDSYNELAKAGEPLAQHRITGRAAAYYAKGEVRDIAVQSELVSFLAGSGRKWAVLPSDQLSEVDLAFRKQTGRHLFVPTLDNAKIMLVASEPIPGKTDQNPLSRFVKKAVPSVQFPVHADFEGKVELVGYNLELPRKDSVGPGQAFHITWIWRAKQPNLGAYQVFLHIDADNQRINGDHDPVDGKYPVRLWDEGDVIVDRQEISVPATSPAGLYTLYVGLYRGESRMKVTDGPRDPADRVRAGTIRVQ